VFGFGALAGPDTAPRISNTWDSNELVARVADQPAYSIALLLACAALATVAVRMWNDPELLRKDGAS